MYDIDLEKMNRALVKSVRLVGAVRGMIGGSDRGHDEVDDLSRELRAAAAECQRVLGLEAEDRNRPLLGADGG